MNHRKGDTILEGETEVKLPRSICVALLIEEGDPQLDHVQEVHVRPKALVIFVLFTPKHTYRFCYDTRELCTLYGGKGRARGCEGRTIATYLWSSKEHRKYDNSSSRFSAHTSRTVSALNAWDIP